MHRVNDKGDPEQVSIFINEEIKRHTSYTKTKKGTQDEKVMRAIEKFEGKDTTLIDESNVLAPVDDVVLPEQIANLIKDLLEQKLFAQTFHIPHIIVMTSDTQQVVDLCKVLKEKFAKEKNGIEVKVQKLFSKHITVEEHSSLLKSAKAGKYLNVYVGVPNRIKKLIEVGTIKVKSSQFKCLVFDTHLNPKNFSIFDVWETRDDTYDILMLAQKRLIKRDLQVMLV